MAASFLPPEAFGQIFDQDDPDQNIDFQSMSSWDLATRYHEIKNSPGMKKKIPQLRRVSAIAVLERAQEILGAAVHPTRIKESLWFDVPADAIDPEFDLENSLDESPIADELWMSYRVRKPQPILFAVDTSLSMTGEKIALTAVALAVVLLQFPDDPIGIVAFENEAAILKNPEEILSIPELIERFLDVPAQGYTHLESGMKAALRLESTAQRRAQGCPPVTILLSDGKYTAGRDPTYLASRFKKLIVMKMGKEKAALPLCRALSKQGRGVLLEVNRLEELPETMYDLVKDLLRGRQ